MKDLTKSIYISPTDKWAVCIKCPHLNAGSTSMYASTCMTHIIAPEILAPDYKKTNVDWKKIIGTGPFMLKDYVGASSLTYIKNTDYWGYDPFFPENKIPYVDTFKMLIVPDISTQQAGMRTGKIDMLYFLTSDSAEALLKSNPELLSVHGNTSVNVISMRNDVKPFDDIRVRQALMLAINHQELKDVFYEGKAEMFVFPLRDIPEHGNAFIPLEEMPESVQELYEYHPDKAKQLLKEAGYPDGFKCEILAWSNEMVDLLSIIKEYWADVGITLNIDVRDYTIYTTMSNRNTYSQGIITQGNNVYVYTALTDMKVGGSANRPQVNDPEVLKLYYDMQENYFDQEKLWECYLKPVKDSPNFAAYANDQAWFTYLPSPWRYMLWQPWLKGYGGAFWGPTYHMEYEYPKFIWIDQELKKSLGH